MKLVDYVLLNLLMTSDEMCTNNQAELYLEKKIQNEISDPK